jgi:hypothetical protein
MQSAYNLLPSQKYFDVVSDPVIKFEDSINSIFNFSANSLPQAVSDYTNMSEFLLMSNRGNTQSEPINIPSILRSDLVSNASEYVSNLANWQLSPSIKVFELAGWGESTTKGISYGAKQENVCSNQAGLYVCNQQSEWDRKLLTTQDGDGTVVLPSAVAYDTQNEYYFNIFEYNEGRSNIKHHNILESSQLLGMVSNIVDKNVDDNSLPNYISTVKPVSTSQSLQLSIHSPVSIGVTDAQGRYTGISSTTPTDAFTFVQEEIPNSYYTELGEDKYIGLPEGGNYNVLLQGTGVGTFTFDQEVSQGDSIVASKSFIDIPVTPLMKADLVVSVGNLSPSLNLDTDGDGVVDVQVQSSTEFDPVSYLTVMKSVIKSFDLKKSQEKDLVNKIDNLIKLIGKGKISKASIKAEAYVGKLNSKLEKTNEERIGKKGNNKLTQLEIQIIIQGLEELINNLK